MPHVLQTTSTNILNWYRRLCWESHEKSSLWFHIFLGNRYWKEDKWKRFRYWSWFFQQLSFLPQLAAVDGKRGNFLETANAPPQKISLVQLTRRNFCETWTKFTFSASPPNPLAMFHVVEVLPREPRNVSRVACNRFQNFPRDMFQRFSTSCRVASIQPFKLFHCRF